MTARPTAIGALAAVLLLGAGACGPGGAAAPTATAPPAPAPRAAARPRAVTPPEPAPLVEDELGVPGGPTDETGFDFEPDDADGPPLVTLDGVPPFPDELTEAIAPYLGTRRAKVASFQGRDGPMLVLTQLGETTQAFEVRAPLGRRRQVTRSDEPVVQAAYAPQSPDVVVYRSDVGGDEDHQIYRLDEGGEPVRLTDGESRHGPFVWGPRGHRLAFTSNAREPAQMDLHVGPGLAALDASILMPSGGSWTALSWSRDGGSVLVRDYRSFLESTIHVVDVERGTHEALAPSQPDVSFTAARFSADGRRVYVVANLGATDFLGLHELRLGAGAFRPLVTDLQADVEEIALSPDGRSLAFTTNEDGFSRLRVLDLSTGAARLVDGLPAGVYSRLRFATAGARLVMTIERPTAPGDAYTFDVTTGELSRWTESEVGGLDEEDRVSPTVERVRSFDGLEVPLLYYRPAGDGPHPALLWMHGGPEDQSRPVFNPVAQLFVRELGVAVLVPNVRGSDGYGRRYLSLDDGERREDAVADVGAILDWIEDRPELDGARVGIHGASYGGYMVLASMVHHADRIAAGCDVVGVSSFVTFLENTREYRRDQRRAEYGDERDPEMRERLIAMSPLTHARPLLVAHGLNDPRVPASEAEQIVDAVRAAGAPVWYMLAHDEGHGFRKRRSRDLFYGIMVRFFDEHLGVHRFTSDEPQG